MHAWNKKHKQGQGSVVVVVGPWSEAAGSQRSGDGRTTLVKKTRDHHLGGLQYGNRSRAKREHFVLPYWVSNLGLGGSSYFKERNRLLCVIFFSVPKSSRRL